jgi:adenylate cyclase
MEIAVANSVRGYIEICRGEYDLGRSHLHEGIGQARALHPVNNAIILIYWSTLVALGMYQADELVDEMRDTMRRADSFGDICGTITAQSAYGTVLLRAKYASHDEAIDVLNRAHANIQKHKVFTLTLATIDADLAVDAARRGRRDEAIDDLRTSFLLNTGRGFRPFAGRAGEALVELLIDRGSFDDLSEARRVVDQWQAQRPGIPALDLWWLKSCALLAKAEGDSEAYAALTKQYLELCEKLDARGRLAEAHRMVE